MTAMTNPMIPTMNRMSPVSCRSIHDGSALTAQRRTAPTVMRSSDEVIVMVTFG
jgi:hypothetical protein